jgi:hypothetical protein
VIRFTFTLVGDFYEARRKREAVHSQGSCKAFCVASIRMQRMLRLPSNLRIAICNLNSTTEIPASTTPPSHRGDTRIGGRGRLTAKTSCDQSGGNGKHPQAEASRDHSGGNVKQADLAHLSSPVRQQPQQRSLRLSQAPSLYPDRGLSCCDGHHEMVD